MLASCYPGVSSRESSTSQIVLQIAAIEMAKGQLLVISPKNGLRFGGVFGLNK
jgi:hypothetical protein